MVIFSLTVTLIKHTHKKRVNILLQIMSAFTTLLALITPALSQRRPILRRPLFRQEQISIDRHLGPLLTPRYGKVRKIRKKAKFLI